MSASAVIFGLSGPRLTANEAAFFRDAQPWAFILFARNIETPNQVEILTRALRKAVGRDCLIFIDQEGGRVQRMRPPHWRNYPALAHYGALYEGDPSKAKRAAFLHHRLIADDLRAVGVTASCAPVLDLPQSDADAIISDRAFSPLAQPMVDLAHAAMAGLMCGGVAPVIKHIPGHGRALVDSHKSLPRIETPRETLDSTDFIPFRALSEAPMAMTAHAVYACSDSEAPITTSRKALTELIRGDIGFDGLLMTDDLDMKALEGTHMQKTRRSLAAGCDVVLHCSGEFKAMVSVAKGARPLSGRALSRARISENCADFITQIDRRAAMREFEALTSESVA